MDTALAASPVDGATADEQALAPAEDRRMAVRGVVLGLGASLAWSLGSFGLALVFVDAASTHGVFGDSLFTSLGVLILTLSGAAPVPLWFAGLIRRRRVAARMARVAADEPQLDALTPGLRVVLADTRLARAAVESRELDGDMAALRAVWEWLQRLAELPEAERRELDDAGVDERGVAETLRWSIAHPFECERGLAILGEQLRSLEQSLLRARVPYR